MKMLKHRLLAALVIGVGIAGASGSIAQAGWHGHHHNHHHHGHWHGGIGFGFAPTFVFGEREVVREYVPPPAPVYQPVPVYYPAPVYQQPAAPVYQQPASGGDLGFDQSYCREYENSAKIDGRIVKTYGLACRQPDGTWRLVN